MTTITFPRSNPGHEYTINDLSKIANLIEEFRADLLFSSDWAGIDCMAEQHLLLSISALEQAHRYASLADLHQTRALTKI